MMKTMFGKVLAPLLVAGLIAGPVAADEATLIAHGKTAITAFDLKQAVSAQVPKDSQGLFYGNEKKLREFLGAMFVKAKLAEYASQRELTPEEQWRVDEARRRVLSQIELDRRVAASAIPDLEPFALDVYRATPERFAVKPSVRAQHVLISTQERSPEEALAIAQKVRKLALDGTPFENLATEYSDDPSAEKNKGDLGFFTAGRMVKPFEEAAFALNEVGEISEPVQTQFGYHVIRLVEKQGERMRSFEEVKQALMDEERKKYRSNIVNEQITKIGTLEGVAIDNDAIQALIIRFDPHAASGKSATHTK